MAKAVATAEDQPQWKSAHTRLGSFLKDVRSEMKKVIWPSRGEVESTTTVVIITVFFFAAYFWVVDAVIGKAIEAALHKMVGH